MPEDQLDPATAVVIGRIVTAHGIRGEVKVEPLTDFPDRFRAGREVWLAGTHRRIERSRWQNTLVLLKFADISTRNEAETLRGAELMLPEARELNEGRYYLHDIVGLRVEDEAGAVLGKVADVLSTGANDVYVVRGPRGELLLPAVEDVVKEIDVGGGRVVVEVLPGLEFRPTASRRPRRPAKTATSTVEEPSAGL